MSDLPQTQQTDNQDDSGREAHLAFVQDVRDAIWDHDTRWLTRLLGRLHPADAADLLEQLSSDDFAACVDLLGEQLPTNVIIELRDEYREEAVEVLPDEAVAAVLEQLDSDDVTTILEDLEDERRERILEELSPEDRASLEQGFAYDEETAGRLMQREYFAAPEFWTVGHTIDHARDNAETLPTEFFQVFVIDPAHKLKGQVPLALLLRTARDVNLSDIMEEVESDITVDMDQEEAAYQFQKYSLASAPVTDDTGRLLGMLTVDDVVDVIQEENTEDLLALSGVNSADGSDTVLDSVKARAPWLAVNLITAFIASGIISIFENTLDQIVQLAILMPVVAALGGNAGSQGLAVAVRAIAEREMEGDAGRRAILRETLTGLANGVIFAIGVAIIAYIWFQNVGLSIAISIAMFLTFVWAGFSGVVVPLALKRAGADPAVASSVFVLTLTDIMAFFSFLGLATLILV
ncbi:magnesium transporter [Henriciella litoralis]|uniref:magnesium transporter n=1 Tax=Henriciella litoralis TaxID=568102 RepID=UPI0009FDCEB4|nr:magnesium transporter [Henriciella litoralis]